MFIRTLFALAFALALSGQAVAAEGDDLEVDGEVALVSDYRFRGISLTGLEPALQAGVTVSHASGLYVGAWTSNISESGGGANAEVDFIAGFALEKGPASLDLSATYYAYPGDSALNYAELSAVLTFAAGPVQPWVELSYVPPQSATRRETGGRADNVYVATGAEVAIAGSPVSLIGQIGYERGFFDGSERGGKLDWQIGAAIDAENVRFQLGYVDSNRRVQDGRDNLAGAGVLAQLTLSF